MHSRRYYFLPLMCLAIPSLCHGDITVTFLDAGEPVQLTINTAGPFSCGLPNPEACATQSDGAFASNLDLKFNIYDPGNVALSDTLEITTDSTGSHITSNFLSDSESGPPLVALANGASITEDGTVQTAASIADGDVHYVVRFQSDLDLAPEPSFLGLLSLGALALGVAGRARRP